MSRLGNKQSTTKSCRERTKSQIEHCVAYYIVHSSISHKVKKTNWLRFYDLFVVQFENDAVTRIGRPQARVSVP